MCANRLMELVNSPVLQRRTGCRPRHGLPKFRSSLQARWLAPNAFVPKDVLGNPLSIPAHDSSYDGNFVYRGNPTIVASLSGAMSYAYDIGGNPYETQDGDGMIVTVATSSSTGASLPATLTPNGNGNLASNITYSTSYALTSVSGANGANQSVSYDAYNRPGQATSVDGAITAYTYTYVPNTPDRNHQHDG